MSRAIGLCPKTLTPTLSLSGRGGAPERLFDSERHHCRPDEARHPHPASTL